MSVPPTPAPAPPKKSGLLKKLGLAAGALLVVLVVAYFVVTSTLFQKGVVLPRVAKAIGAELLVEDSEISPFSQVVLRGVKLQVPGGEPIFTAKEIRARYSLLAILRGDITVEEAAVSGATINVVQNPDGTFNFTPILQATASKEPKAAKPPAPASPPRLNIKTIAVQDSTMRFAKSEKSGARLLAELGRVNVKAQNIQNGQTGKLTIETDVKFEQVAGAAAALDLLAARFNSTFDFTLQPDLIPQAFKGGFRLDTTQVGGAFMEARDLATILDLDLTMTDIKRVAFTVAREQQQLATVSASGPFDMMKQEGKLRLDVAGLDKNVLNLVGAKLGLDFGNTSIALANEITLTKAGKAIAATGQFTAANFAVTQPGAATPPLDLKLAYQLAVDLPAQSATVSAFNLTGTRGQQPTLAAALSKPLSLSWSTNATDNVSDSEFTLNVTGLNLADWRPFIGKFAPDGRVDVAMQVAAQNMGRQLGVNLTANVADLTAIAGTNRVARLGANVSVKAAVADFKRVKLDLLNAKATQAGQQLVEFAATGNADLGTMSADLGVSFAASLTRAASLVSVPGVKVTGGQAGFAGRVAQQVTIANKQTNTTQTIAGKMNLTDFSGGFESYAFDRLTTAVDVDADLANGVQAVVRKLAVALTHAGQPAGTVEATANFNVKQTAGTASVKVAGLNESLLRPVLAPALGDKQLVSGNLSLTLDANLNPAADSPVKADLQIARLQIADPSRGVPNLPFDLRVVTDATVRQPAANQFLVTLRQLAGAVSANGKPGGSFDLAGNFDSKAMAGAATVKLTDFNESLLGPVLASALGDKRLVSATLNANVNAKFAAKGESALTGDLSVARFLMADPGNTLPTVPMDLRVAVDGSFAQPATNQMTVAVRKLTGTIAQGAASGGNFDVAGNFDSKAGGQFTLKLADLNQNALKPFLAGALGDKQLQTVSINANASGRFEPSGDAAVKADFTVDKLLVRDPKGALPETPLALQVVLDGGKTGQVVDVRQLLLALSPTARGKNQLLVTGRADLSNTNAAQANFKVAAESLDLTPFYDLFDNAQKKKAVAAAQPAPAPQAPLRLGLNEEPPALQIPLRQSSLDVNIGRIFLREMAISNLVAAAKVDTNRVTVRPVSLLLNGAPVSAHADANLGVPGYQYDLAFKADRVPVLPVASSFTPGVGRVQGDFIADVAIRGKGLTGESLQRTLDGHMRATYTNAQIEIELSPSASFLLRPIAFFLRMPELLKRPLDYVNADVQLGRASIEIRDLSVRSSALFARTPGIIPLQAVLADSPIEQEVEVWLPRELAKRLSLGGGDSGSGAYRQLPIFLTVTGTLGDPRVKENKLVLGGMVAGGIAGALGGKTGDIGKSVGGALGELGKGNVGGALGNIFGGAKPATNAPPGAVPAPPPNQPAGQPAKKINPLDLLNPFLKKK